MSSRVPPHLRTEPSEELVRSLPKPLLESVFVAGNGELFWPRPIATEAARWLAGRGAAIVGGEVYVPRPPAWGSFVRQWAVDPERGPDEGWTAYGARCLDLAIREIEAGAGGAPLNWDADELLFFFAESR